MHILRYCLPFLLGAAAAGCSTVVVRSEADLFLLRHPELRSHYTRLSPTDADSLKEIAYERYATWTYAIEAIQKNTSDEKATKENERRLQITKAIHQEDIAVARELEKAAKSTGGKIYFYEYRNGTNSEWGYFVLNGGKIVTKAGIIVGEQHD